MVVMLVELLLFLFTRLLMLVAKKLVRLSLFVVFICTDHFFPVSERRTEISLLSVMEAK